MQDVPQLTHTAVYGFDPKPMLLLTQQHAECTIVDANSRLSMNWVVNSLTGACACNGPALGREACFHVIVHHTANVVYDVPGV